VNPHSQLKLIHSKADCPAIQMKELKHLMIRNQFDFQSSILTDSSEYSLSNNSETTARDSHLQQDCSKIPLNLLLKLFHLKEGVQESEYLMLQFFRAHESTESCSRTDGKKCG
jgi:hypothetical protein